MIALIDEIFDTQTLLTKLNFPPTVNIDPLRLIGAGHSFGGMTAIATASLDSRIKALITLDPWLYCKHLEILKGQYNINIPIFILTSETFHPFCE